MGTFAIFIAQNHNKLEGVSGGGGGVTKRRLKELFVVIYSMLLSIHEPVTTYDRENHSLEHATLTPSQVQ